MKEGIGIVVGVVVGILLLPTSTLGIAACFLPDSRLSKYCFPGLSVAEIERNSRRKLLRRAAVMYIGIFFFGLNACLGALSIEVPLLKFGTGFLGLVLAVPGVILYRQHAAMLRYMTKKGA